MDWKKSVSVAALLTGLLLGSAAAADYGEGNARVRLVRSAEEPGKETSFFLGVEFSIRPGWHIYWRNPGGAGLATEIQWRLPEGLAARDLLWPVPVGFTQSGDVPGYGYEETVVLAASMRSDDGIGGELFVGAEVSWLACKDVCVLGSAELGGALAALPIEAGFDEWFRALPRPFDDENPAFSVTTRGGLAEGTLGLWLQWRQAPRAVEWFPAPQDGLEVTGITIQTRGGLTRIDSLVRKMQGSSGTSNTLESVLVMTDDDGVRRGWNLAVDVGR